MNEFRALLAALFLASGAVLAQTPWKGVGTVLAVEGEVFVRAKETADMAVAAFSVLDEGMTLRLGPGAQAKLVHNKEGTTYQLKGPATVKVSATDIAVDPPAAIASRTSTKVPVELTAPGGAPTPGQGRSRQVGGESLDNTRAGLVAKAEAPAAASTPAPATAVSGPRESDGVSAGAIVWFLIALGMAVAIYRAKRKKTLAIVALLLLLGWGGWYIFRPAPAPEMRELMAALERAKAANEALSAARAKGDPEEIRRHEAALKAAMKTAEDRANAAGESKKRTDAQKRAESQKSAMDDRAAAEKAAADARAAAEKAAAEKTAAAKSAPPEAPKSKVTTAMSAAERLAIREEEDARAKAASAPTSVAAAAPSAASTELTLLQQARAAEAAGNIKGAVRLYIRALRAGEMEAAVALAEIFAEGKGDVPKDYAESLRYFAIAEKAGIKVERAKAR